MRPPPPLTFAEPVLTTSLTPFSGSWTRRSRLFGVGTSTCALREETSRTPRRDGTSYLDSRSRVRSPFARFIRLCLPHLADAVVSSFTELDGFMSQLNPAPESGHKPLVDAWRELKGPDLVEYSFRESLCFSLLEGSGT